MALRRRRDGDRRGAPSDLVIVGLANPGEEFESSRHNVGGDAVRELAGRLGVGLKVESRQRCISGTFDALRGRVTLAVPTTFMNDSGAAFPPLLKRTSPAPITEEPGVRVVMELELKSKTAPAATENEPLPTTPSRAKLSVPV